MTQLARLGFVLLGLDTILGSASLLVATFSQFAMEEHVVGVIISLSWAVFALVPGTFLVLRSRALAERLFGPPESQSMSLDTHTLLSAGLAVAGVWLVLSGVAILAGAGAQVLLMPPIGVLDSYAVRDAVHGVSSLLFGCVLAFRARRVSRFLLRVPEVPAA